MSFAAQVKMPQHITGYAVRPALQHNDIRSIMVYRAFNHLFIQIDEHIVIDPLFQRDIQGVALPLTFSHRVVVPRPREEPFPILVKT
jgi:hypothetical protein